MHSNPLRISAPTAKPAKAPDYEFASFKEWLDWQLDICGGDYSQGDFPPITGGQKEAAFKAAVRRAGYYGSANLDIDQVYGTKAGKAVLAVSFKCGGEAPSNGWHLKVQKSALAIPLLELRQVDGDTTPENSRYTATWL